MITEYSLLYMATASFHLAGLSTIFLLQRYRIL
ncbi:hypothetical protein B0F89_102127 [Malaciobacter marinus]|jgi:hypothetical protein|uniref:Uncharacterized protein n=1 Tax=Malaciobacter marinus TaxID=505249 RepID=A0AB37A155_9BACT|nr:hypothetical protein B0F89_102127 [Malaciobacter marinus]SKB73806.1 hypothetical protein SAMN06295997_13715 [Malaciobacter marinus]